MKNHKIKEWLFRYGPAEICGILVALLACSLLFFFTKNNILVAYAGTFGENLGYYGFILVRDIYVDFNRFGGYSFLLLSKLGRNLLIEFGPSEFLDTLVIRPFMMFIFPLLTGNLIIGIILGKIAADIIFYIPTIFAYELRKKYLK